MVFQPSDWIWVHIQKEGFLDRHKSKLDPRGDRTFQVLERVNDKSFKIDLLGEYGVSATLNFLIFPFFD